MSTSKAGITQNVLTQYGQVGDDFMGGLGPHNYDV